MSIKTDLISLADPSYREFHSKLMPNVEKERILGVRIPILRKYAKELFKTRNAEAMDFTQALPHELYEENNLHAFIIEQIKDFDKALDLTEKFLPYIDNWATCDMFFSKVFAKNEELMKDISLKWIGSHHAYTCRYGIGIAMRMFLDKNFDMVFHHEISNIRSQEYYVNMMRAWYFATALAKQYENTVPLLEQKCLDKWTHNMTIKKSCESFRISPGIKSYLKTLKM